MTHPYREELAGRCRRDIALVTATVCLCGSVVALAFGNIAEMLWAGLAAFAHLQLASLYRGSKE